MMPPILVFTAFVFAFGMVTGSFLNVCISRIPKSESVVFPPSHCPLCNYRIRWYDNIPLVSYLLLRGRCRDGLDDGTQAIGEVCLVHSPDTLGITPTHIRGDKVEEHSVPLV